MLFRNFKILDETPLHSAQLALLEMIVSCRHISQYPFPILEIMAEHFFLLDHFIHVLVSFLFIYSIPLASHHHGAGKIFNPFTVFFLVWQVFHVSLFDCSLTALIKVEFSFSLFTSQQIIHLNLQRYFTVNVSFYHYFMLYIFFCFRWHLPHVSIILILIAMAAFVWISWDPNGHLLLQSQKVAISCFISSYS